MARLQIHEHAKVGSLTPPQITQLTAFLSSPSTAPPPMMTPLASPNFTPPAATRRSNTEPLKKGVDVPIVLQILNLRANFFEK
ncbi:hypothetical protein RHS01_02646 [Rhizoctonia solani]|uniref:Uncharacterized protein n=1 Tax=Rhizoctonia solani TaxID=456999 RepID=A0A8H7M7K0_9AGAM|nr:hypothetical protein RHS01_02646 [Rhizoctonia solani]